MDERNYKRIENGERKNIDLALVERFCEVLQVPVTKLLGVMDNTPTHQHIMLVQWEIIKSQRNVMDTLYELTCTSGL
jgi:transcriptional regulator with XRE-family HTH domain